MVVTFREFIVDIVGRGGCFIDPKGGIDLEGNGFGFESLASVAMR